MGTNALKAPNWSGEMSELKPEFNECGVMTAYVNSQGHLQHVAADRYNALRKKIITENNQRDEAQRAEARQDQASQDDGPI